MKTIKPRDTREIEYDDLKMGDLVGEGLILEFHRETRLLYTILGPVWVPEGAKVNVLARVDPVILEAYTEAANEEDSPHHCGEPGCTENHGEREK